MMQEGRITISKIYGQVEVINCPKPDVGRILLIECCECPFHKDNHCTFNGLQLREVCPYCSSYRYHYNPDPQLFICADCDEVFKKPEEVFV